MKVYACGGTGINIVKSLNLKTNEVTYIDTSLSNIKGVPEESLYIIKDMEGAGKFRKTSYDGSKEEISDIIFKHKPSEVNILVASASGGSGSIISSLLLDELLKQNKTVIVAYVASYDSGLETENTLKAINTLASLSLSNEKPVVCFFEENISDGKTNGRKESDERIRALIAYVSIILDGSDELDIEDIKNFANYSKVTGEKPGLVYLETLVDTNELEENTGTAISALTVVKNTNVRYTLTPNVPYQAVGVLTGDSIQTDIIHLIILDGYFQRKINELEKRIKEYKSNIKSVKPIEVEKGQMFL